MEWGRGLRRLPTARIGRSRAEMTGPRWPCATGGGVRVQE